MTTLPNRYLRVKARKSNSKNGKCLFKHFYVKWCQIGEKWTEQLLFALKFSIRMIGQIFHFLQKLFPRIIISMKRDFSAISRKEIVVEKNRLQIRIQRPPKPPYPSSTQKKFFSPKKRQDIIALPFLEAEKRISQFLRSEYRLRGFRGSRIQICNPFFSTTIFLRNIVGKTGFHRYYNASE